MPTDAIYARFSSERQTGGTSIDVQVAACEEFIRRTSVGDTSGGGGSDLSACPPSGVRLSPSLYIDQARSGRSVAGRPELLRLVADCEAGKIARVFVHKFDRLGRSASTHVLVEDLEAMGVRVVSVTEGENSLARGVGLVVAADYSRVLAERTSAGLVQRHREGRWTGGLPPYGYRVDNTDGIKRIVVEPAEAAHVLAAFTAYAAGAGLREVARLLDARRAPTRCGAAEWSGISVRGILMNPVAVGRPEFRRRKYRLDRASGARKRRMAPASDRVVRADESLRIVSEELWRRVAERFESGRVGTSGGGSGGGHFRGGRVLAAEQTRPFSGLLRCGLCGAACYAASSRNARGSYRYYTCGRKVRLGAKACALPRVREDRLVAIVRGAVDQILGDRRRLLADLADGVARALDQGRRRADQIGTDIADADATLRRLALLLIDPDVEAAARRAVSRQMAELEARRDALVAELGARAQDSMLQAEEITRACVRVLDDVHGLLEGGAAAALNRALAAALGGEIVLTPEGGLRPAAARQLKHPGHDVRAVCDTHDAAMSLVRRAFWFAVTHTAA